MQGLVTRDLEPRISLTIYYPDGTQETVPALVDTGFSGELVVTDAIARRLTPLRSVQTKTADGASHMSQGYRASIGWNTQRRNVLALQMGEEVLIGMELLFPETLTVEAVHNGRVEIK